MFSQWLTVESLIREGTSLYNFFLAHRSDVAYTIFFFLFTLRTTFFNAHI